MRHLVSVVLDVDRHPRHLARRPLRHTGAARLRAGAWFRRLRTLADICVERGYHRLEWWVLDWNTPSIGFYESIGAVAQDEGPASARWQCLDAAAGSTLALA